MLKNEFIELINNDTIDLFKLVSKYNKLIQKLEVKKENKQDYFIRITNYRIYILNNYVCYETEHNIKELQSFKDNKLDFCFVVNHKFLNGLKSFKINFNIDITTFDNTDIATDYLINNKIDRIKYLSRFLLRNNDLNTYDIKTLKNDLKPKFINHYEYTKKLVHTIEKFQYNYSNKTSLFFNNKVYMFLTNICLTNIEDLHNILIKDFNLNSYDLIEFKQILKQLDIISD